MRWLPRSLAGQWLALLLLAMLLAHAVAVGVVTVQGNAAQIHPLSLQHIQARTVAAYRLATTQPLLADHLLGALDRPESRYRRVADAPAQVLASRDQETELLQGVRASLGLPASVPLYGVLYTVPTFSASLFGTAAVPVATPDAEAMWVLEMAVPLPDGQWLYGQHHPVMMHPHWERVLQFSLATSVLSSLLIAVLFGRSMMQPLRALTQAAQRVSRGEAVAALPLQGPQSVRAITAAFNDMQQRIRRFVQDRMQLLASIGHDLRTPLASLRIRVEMVTDATLRAALRKSIDEMTVMVQETLHFAQDDAQTEPTRKVDLATLIADVVQHQRLLGKTVHWQALVAIPCHCRPVHIKRALQNLIDNAARYGQVSVRVTTQAGHCHIFIEDNGPGIDPAQMEQVFAPFVRLDAARNLATGGSGLGLAVARSLIRAHGGDITLHNRSEGGLCAVIALPIDG